MAHAKVRPLRPTSTKSIMVNVRLDEDQKWLLDQIADACDIPTSDVMRDALEAYAIKSIDAAIREKIEATQALRKLRNAEDIIATAIRVAENCGARSPVVTGLLAAKEALDAQISEVGEIAFAGFNKEEQIGDAISQGAPKIVPSRLKAKGLRGLAMAAEKAEENHGNAEKRKAR